jgi:hypothetical protein
MWHPATTDSMYCFLKGSWHTAVCRPTLALRHAAGMAHDQRSTVRLIVVVWLKLPDTPFTVTLKVPVFAVPLAVNVRPLVLVAGFVPNDAFTPFGKPDAESVTLPAKPLVGVIMMVLVP